MLKTMLIGALTAALTAALIAALMAREPFASSRTLNAMSSAYVARSYVVVKCGGAEKKTKVRSRARGDALSIGRDAPGCPEAADATCDSDGAPLSPDFAQVIKANLDPVWNESVELSGDLNDFLATGLTLRVMDKDLLTKDDPLGDLTVNLEELKAGKILHDYCEKLDTQGGRRHGRRRGRHPHTCRWHAEARPVAAPMRTPPSHSLACRRPSFTRHPAPLRSHDPAQARCSSRPRGWPTPVLRPRALPPWPPCR